MKWLQSIISLLTGRRKRPHPATPATQNRPSFPPPDPQLNSFLKDLFLGHGGTASIDGDWVVIDGGKLRARASHCNHRETADHYQLQMDVVVAVSPEQHIVESFAGIGANRAAALKDACRAFADCTFHALISAFLQRKCDHVDEEIWDIAGAKRRVTMGMLSSRGKVPASDWPAAFKHMEAQIKTSELPAGPHWIRFFYANIVSAPMIEVLLDNKPWPAAQTRALSIPWPQSREFYSARLFFVVQDALPT